MPISNLGKRLLRLFLALALVAGWHLGGAQAAPVVPTSYDMINGGTGSYEYWDQIYNGSGSTTTSYALLTGGVGDLTDGVIATQNWNVVEQPPGNGPYVGWNHGHTPVITFKFGGLVGIETVTVYVDDSNGSGGVSLPASIRIQMGAYDHTFLVSEDVDATPNVLIYSGLGLKGDTLDLTLNRSNIWVFCSEVQFEGTPIPLPPAFVLLGSGVLVLAGAGRWRRR